MECEFLVQLSFREVLVSSELDGLKAGECLVKLIVYGQCVMHSFIITRVTPTLMRQLFGTVKTSFVSA